MQETSRAGDLPSAAERLAATRFALSDNLDRLTQSTERLIKTFRASRDGRSERDVLHEETYARLLARLHTMPVIEQAKGILMAESRCSPDEAFAMLRAASQRSNTKIRDLAEEIVGRVSGDGQRAPDQRAADEPSPAG